MINQIKRAKELNLTPQQIDYIFFNDLQHTKEVLLKHGLTSKRPPGSYPDSYFIDRLTKNYTIKMIADELNCTRAAVYRTLNKRGITPDAYRTQIT